MTTAPPDCQIIPFPEIRRWSREARKYVDYFVSGDPRAANFYLEYELRAMNVSRSPLGLQQAIDSEYRKRGFPGELLFD